MSRGSWRCNFRTFRPTCQRLFKSRRHRLGIEVAINRDDHVARMKNLRSHIFHFVIGQRLETCASWLARFEVILSINEISPFARTDGSGIIITLLESFHRIAFGNLEFRFIKSRILQEVDENRQARIEIRLEAVNRCRTIPVAAANTEIGCHEFKILIHLICAHRVASATAHHCSSH